MRSPGQFKYKSRKFIFGWIGGLLLFLSSLGVGFYISSEFPADSDYNLSIDFVSLKKLEFLARSDSNISALHFNDGEMKATLQSSKQAVPVKVSSMKEPFSDVSKNLLSFFIISEDESNRFLLLSKSSISTNYLEWTTSLYRVFNADAPPARLIRLKTNGMDSRDFYQVDLPIAGELEFLSIKDALLDKGFKSQFPGFNLSVIQTPLSTKIHWPTELLIYFHRDANRTLKISHLLPAAAREAYE